MKRSLYILPLVLLFLLPSCREGNELQEEFDRILENRAEYETRYLAEIAELERQLPLASGDSVRFELAAGLFEKFRSYNIDSAEFYAGKMAEIDDCVRTKVARSIVLAARRNYAEGFQLLESVDRSALSERDLVVLFDAYQTLSSLSNNEYGLSDEQRKENKDRRRYYQTRTLELRGLTPYEKLYYTGRLLISEKHYREAIDTLEKAMTYNPPYAKAVHCAYAIATCYKDLGDDKAFENSLYRSMIIDIEAANKQYRSLYDLALLMYEKGDLQRAQHYIQVTLLDAISSNYNVRIVNAMEAAGIINAASAQMERRNSVLFLTVMVVLLILFAVTIFFLQKVYRQRKRLETAYSQVRELNEELNDLNLELKEEAAIKESCLFRYMNLSVRFIDNIENYRRSLRDVFKDKGVDGLLEKLKEQDYLYMQYSTFYKLFDEIFLGIFPGFIDNVNARLPEGSKFCLKKDGSFPTELRILAAMRIGITKSSNLAEFLNCPSGSVYTYKANLKKLLKCEDSSLEELVSGF